MLIKSMDSLIENLVGRVPGQPVTFKASLPSRQKYDWGDLLVIANQGTRRVPETTLDYWIKKAYLVHEGAQVRMATYNLDDLKWLVTYLAFKKAYSGSKRANREYARFYENN